MKQIKITLDKPTLSEADKIIQRLRSSRNTYITEAVIFYNQYQSRRLLEKQLTEESELIAEDSMEVLLDFEMLQKKF